jgi:pyruvate dehydrogenase E2 component (dihydrolipoamide acetyltransferase)
VDGETTARLIMPLSQSMDHRIIDGAVEIAFMRQLIGDLENPGRLLL